jgi:hypothetical protein
MSAPSGDGAPEVLSNYQNYWQDITGIGIDRNFRLSRLNGENHEMANVFKTGTHHCSSRAYPHHLSSLLSPPPAHSALRRFPPSADVVTSLGRSSEVVAGTFPQPFQAASSSAWSTSDSTPQILWNAGNRARPHFQCGDSDGFGRRPR